MSDFILAILHALVIADFSQILPSKDKTVYKYLYELNDTDRLKSLELFLNEHSHNNEIKSKLQTFFAYKQFNYADLKYIFANKSDLKVFKNYFYDLSKSKHA